MFPPRSKYWDGLRQQEEAQARLSRVTRDPILRAAAGLSVAAQALAELAEQSGHVYAARQHLAKAHAALVEAARQLR